MDTPTLPDLIDLLREWESSHHDEMLATVQLPPEMLRRDWTDANRQLAEAHRRAWLGAPPAADDAGAGE